MPKSTGAWRSMPLYGQVLIADDEPRMRTFLRAALREDGFGVVEAHDGQEAILRASIDRPNVVVLDLDMPDLGGTDLIKRVRECTDVPIIGLRALGSAWRKDQILDSGGSDCLVKPFGAVTFAAHVKGMLRARAAASTVPRKVRRGAITIDLARERVLRNGEEIKLTPREFSLLRLLAQELGRVVTHDEILGNVWGRQASAPKAPLHTYVSRLRRKLEADGSAPRLIMTEPAGYRIAADAASEARVA